MEQTLEQAAANHHLGGRKSEKGSYAYNIRQAKLDSFKAGAEWQKEKDKKLITDCQVIIERLINRTPTGEERNYLCDLNIRLLQRLQD